MSKATDRQEGGGHYKLYEIQPIEFITKNKLPFIEGNIIKYACRHRYKRGVEDLLKIKHYVDLLLELEYNYDEEKESSSTEIPEGTWTREAYRPWIDHPHPDRPARSRHGQKEVQPEREIQEIL